MIPIVEKLKAQKQATDAQTFKGEFVVLVKNLVNPSGHRVGKASDFSEQALQPQDLVWLKSLCGHCPKPLAAKLAAQALGLSREQAYRLILQTQS